MNTIVKVIIGFAIVGVLAWIGIIIAVNLSLGGARKTAKDARITSEMSQLRTQADIIVSKEDGYENFACDYDDYVKALCDDIEQQGGKVTIYTSQDSYCAYTSLNEGEYYCVDSTGAGKEVEMDPSVSCGGGSYKCP